MTLYITCIQPPQSIFYSSTRPSAHIPLILCVGARVGAAPKIYGVIETGNYNVLWRILIKFARLCARVIYWQMADNLILRQYLNNTAHTHIHAKWGYNRNMTVSIYHFRFYIKTIWWSSAMLSTVWNGFRNLIIYAAAETKQWKSYNWLHKGYKY